MFKHPMFWVLCMIVGMFILADAIREPSRHQKPEYAGEPSKHHEKAARPKCVPPTSEQQEASGGPDKPVWLQHHLSDLQKQTREAENAVTEFRAKLRKQTTEAVNPVIEFRAKTDIIGAAGNTVVNEQIVELTNELTRARSQLGDAPATEKQILETRIRHLEWALEAADSESRWLRELESVAQSYRALYDGFVRRHAAEINCAP